MAEKIRALSPCNWPTAERAIWTQAGVAARRLKPGGAAARMKSDPNELGTVLRLPA